MKVILCVTNDVITDRRVTRIACSLMKIFDTVTVVGRFIPKAVEMPLIPFGVKRMRLLFRKKFLFYTEYNIRLFFYLLFSKADIIVANDLDTLPAAFYAARFLKCHLVYDSHEFFTEVPELAGRPFIRNIWLMIERLLLPSLINCYTVSDSIANAYNKLYGIGMKVIRNLPYKNQCLKAGNRMPGGDKVLLYQGSLNKGRGLELVIRAIPFMDNVRLLLVGTGDIETKLKRLVSELNVQSSVEFAGRVRPEDLPEFALRADAGISLERPEGLSYIYSLPNKLFDYIQSGLPVVVSDLPEMSAVVQKYGAGKVTAADDPEKLGSEIMDFLNDAELLQDIRKRLVKAAEELCWENEEDKLLDIYKNL